MSTRLLASVTIALISFSLTARAQEPCLPANSVHPISQQQQAMLADISNGLDVPIGNLCDSESCDKLLKWAQYNYSKYPYCAPFFIDKQGNAGALARDIATLIGKDIVQNGLDSPFAKDYADLDAVCPGYGKMAPSSKVGFWVYFFEILSYNETTCTPTRLNPSKAVPHPPAAGLYQLEYDPSLRSWRGPLCRVSEQAIMTPEGNTGCAFDIYRSQLARSGKPFGTVKDGKRMFTSYWDSLNPPLNPAEQKVSRYPRTLRYLSFYPLCQDATSVLAQPIKK